MPLPGHTTGGERAWSPQHRTMPAIERHRWRAPAAGFRPHRQSHFTGSHPQRGKREIFCANKEHRISRSRRTWCRGRLRCWWAVTISRSAQAMSRLTAGTRSSHFVRAALRRSTVRCHLPRTSRQHQGEQQQECEEVFQEGGCERSRLTERGEVAMAIPRQSAREGAGVAADSE